MMLKIRRTLVKHPYDNVGRSMALETKNLFIRQVLMISKPWDQLRKFFKIPTRVQKYHKVVFFLPMLWATLGTIRKGSVYIYVMSSDIQVIEELRQIPTITAPEIRPQKVMFFFFSKYTETGVFGLKKPCEFLDQIEEIGNEIVPLYKLVISEGANVHWNPNKNTGIPLSSFFKIVKLFG